MDAKFRLDKLIALISICMWFKQASTKEDHPRNELTCLMRSMNRVTGYGVINPEDYRL
jgi:hypothetical protein